MKKILIEINLGITSPHVYSITVMPSIVPMKKSELANMGTPVQCQKE
jgi:hypothetical protein